MSTTVSVARQTFFVYAMCQYYAVIGLGLSVLSLIISVAVPEPVVTYAPRQRGPYVRRPSASSLSSVDSELVQTPKIEIAIAQETLVTVSPADSFFPESVSVEPKPNKSASRPLLSKMRTVSISRVDTIITKVNDAGKKIAFANLKLKKGITKRLRSSSSASLRVPTPKMELRRSETI